MQRPLIWRRCSLPSRCSTASYPAWRANRQPQAQNARGLIFGDLAGDTQRLAGHLPVLLRQTLGVAQNAHDIRLHILWHVVMLR